MIISAGALIKSLKTNRFLFVARNQVTSFAKSWSLVGGKIHNNEHVLDGLTREIYEELGLVPEILKWFLFDTYISKDKQFCYHSVLILTPDEFLPKLNTENIGFAWVDIDCVPKPMHPKLKDVFKEKILLESLKNFH